MVFSAELVPKVGQEFRDRVRCVELENLGYSVKTLDDKHAAETLDHGKHCRANLFFFGSDFCNCPLEILDA